MRVLTMALVGRPHAATKARDAFAVLSMSRFSTVIQWPSKTSFLPDGLATCDKNESR